MSPKAGVTMLKLQAMGYRSLAVVLVLLCFFKTTFAYTTVPECNTLRWQGSAEKELMQIQFDEVPRTKLIQIAWGEALSDPHYSVAALALYYLYATEEHAELKKYYRDIASELGAGKFTMRGLAARYPIRKGNVKATSSLRDLCATYTKASATKHVAVETSYEGIPQR